MSDDVRCPLDAILSYILWDNYVPPEERKKSHEPEGEDAEKPGVSIVCAGPLVPDPWD